MCVCVYVTACACAPLCMCTAVTRRLCSIQDPVKDLPQIFIAITFPGVLPSLETPEVAFNFQVIQIHTHARARKISTKNAP